MNIIFFVTDPSYPRHPHLEDVQERENLQTSVPVSGYLMINPQNTGARPLPWMQPSTDDTWGNWRRR